MGLPAENGTYALVLKASADAEIQVGRLGRLQTRPGFYVYVGSAHGPGGLAARVGRHQQAGKKLRWHVDYVREVTDLIEIWYVISGERLECRWAQLLIQMPGIALPLERFGASDCRCRSHLLFFTANPPLRTFGRLARQTIPDHGTIRSVAMCGALPKSAAEPSARRAAPGGTRPSGARWSAARGPAR